MKVGIGLPAAIPGVDAATLLEWARRADAGPFSSLGTLDRLVFPNLDPLIALAAVVGVTSRIQLMTTVLLAPLRPPGVLAKEVASLDRLSGGRVTLGLGIGGRPDDYGAAPANFRDRGRRFEQQVQTLRRIWSGERVSDQVGPVGPTPARAGGPEILIGGRTPAALARAGRLADGFIAGGSADPPVARGLYETMFESWRAANRPGQPRFVVGAYYALGADRIDRAASYVRDYYGGGADAILGTMPVDAAAIEEKLARLAAVGVDEVIMWPTLTDLDQVDRLVEIVARVADRP